MADVPGLFFAKQVVTNACATQAILRWALLCDWRVFVRRFCSCLFLSCSVILNAENVELGEVMSSFKQFTADFTPELRGEAIGSCGPLREAHNSYARPEPFEIESRAAKEDDDVFHFISYVPFNGCVYELDGLKKGPIELAKIKPGESWLVPAREIIKARINKYVASEIRFNLLQVTKDLRSQWKARIAELEKIVAGDGMDTGADNADPATELENLRNKLAMEEEKFKSWREENIRRRHNYVPFIMNLLQGLGEKGHLTPLLQAAQAKEAQRAPAGKKR